MKIAAAVCAVVAGMTCMALWVLQSRGIRSFALVRQAFPRTRRASPAPSPAPIHSQTVPFQPQSVRLPDNTRVELQAITWGNRHRFQTTEYDPQPVLPNDPQPTNIDALGLWIKVTRDPQGANPRAGLYPRAIRIYDDRGQEAMVCEPMTTVQPLPDASHLICLRAYPRRSREIVVEADYDSRAPTRFHIPNPQIASSPKQTPKSLPCAKQDGELEVTLDGLHPVPSLMAWSGPQERLDTILRMKKLDTLAAFHYRYQGQVDTKWTPAAALNLIRYSDK